MMRFNLADYPGQCVMHVSREEDAATFCEFLNENGRTWRLGSKYEASKTRFQEYGSETVYYFNEGMFGDVTYAERNGYEILCFEEFNWSEGDAPELSMSFDDMFEGV